MGLKYSTQAASGFDASPPSDDGTAVASNEVKWSFIKTKLASPVKDLADNINTALLTHIDESVLDKGVTYTTTAADHKRTINVTAAATISLADAATVATGYIVTIKNSHSAAINIDLATGTDTLDGTVDGTITVGANESITVVTESTADGYLTQTQNSVPAGSVTMWTTATSPSGWVECDGSSQLRTGVYANLFAAIGVTYGNVDGTHFNLPDLRGQFVRGFDNTAGTDPDAASRTDRGDGTTGDNVGTKQADEVEAHTHGASGSHTHTIPLSNTGGNSSVANAGQTPSVDTDTSGSGGNHTHASVGGNENRPINVALMYIIKL